MDSSPIAQEKSRASKSELDDLLSTHDYYEVLGVNRTSSEDEIKRQYKKQALKFHPDKLHLPRANDAFKKISQAYDYLSNPKNQTSPYYHPSNSHYQNDSFSSTNKQSNASSSQSSSSYSSQNNYSNSYGGFNRRDHFNNINGNKYSDEYSSSHSFHHRFSSAQKQTSNNNSKYNSYNREEFNSSTQKHQQSHDFTRSNRKSGKNIHSYRQSNNSGSSLQSILSSFLEFLKILVFLVVFIGGIVSYLQNQAAGYSLSKSGVFSEQRSTLILEVKYFVNAEAFDDRVVADVSYLSHIEQKIEQEYVHSVKYNCTAAQNKQRTYLNQAKKAWTKKDQTHFIRLSEEVDLTSCEQLERIHVIFDGIDYF